MTWKTPIYRLSTPQGGKIEIDVTSSIGPGLGPHQVIKKDLVAFLKRTGGIKKALDFGAGALRHTFPLLKAGLEVCAVEFELAFSRPAGAKALARARRHAGFSRLIWPHEFISDTRRFDVALLCYVLQVMPIHSERKDALKYIYKKLKPDGYLLYMSRYGQLPDDWKARPVRDGYYGWPEREQHSFYREFTTEETHALFESFKFKYLRSLSKRGTEQVFLYGKGSSVWV